MFKGNIKNTRTTLMTVESRIYQKKVAFVIIRNYLVMWLILSVA